MTMSYVTETCVVHNTNIRLLKGGSGEPLLYLHGATGGGEWLPVLETLSQQYTVYAPEHPGYGLSDLNEDIDSMEDLAYFYLDVLDHLGLDQVTVIGSSLGGWLAVEMGIISPERIKKLILVNAAGIRVEGLPDAFILNAENLYDALYHQPAIKQEVAEKVLKNPEMEDLVIRNRMMTSHLAWNPYFHNPKIPNRIHRLKMPTTIIWGREDGLFPVRCGEAYQRLIPHAGLTVIEDSAHFPHIEQPDAFVKAIQPFLTKE